MKSSSKRNIMDFFNTPLVKEVLGNTDLSVYAEEIKKFFDYYNDRDRSGVWRKNIAIWISNGLTDWISRRQKLRECTSNSQEWFSLMYGVNGDMMYKTFVSKVSSTLPSRVEFWMNKGLSKEQALVEVTKRQKAVVNEKVFSRNTSVRCVEYWTSRGHTEEVALEMVSASQRRDLDFYIRKYGDDGVSRYESSKRSRKTTWATKDKVEHAIKATPKKYNENGREMQAIRKFIADNELSPENCKYGRPVDQFCQHIPNVGFRRYDLAVFNNSAHDTLLCIVEYHGPGHVNFSDYSPDLENEYITINGKKLSFLGTYGEAYKNDLAKRTHIEATYPNCKYIVIWGDQYIKGDLKVENLL